MKILVTGGAGFIGSHTVVELIANNFEVVIVDDLSNSRIEVLDGIEQITGTRPLFRQADISREKEVDALFNEWPDIEAIIHFAANKAVNESVRKPMMYYRNNINSLVLLLEKLVERGGGNFVFSSSCTVYGEPDTLPVAEDAPFKPAESPYGRTKQIGEHILQDVCRAEPSIGVISLRYFNPVGAHESALIGELPIGIPNNLIPYIVQTAAGIRDELSVFGNDYNTPDGTPVRDFIHVVDLAIAHVTALNRLLDKKQQSNYEYFNLGTGKGYSVLEAVRAFEEANGVPVKYRIAARRQGDVASMYADPTHAREVLGWSAKKGIHEMMTSAWRWQRHLMEHPN